MRCLVRLLSLIFLLWSFPGCSGANTGVITSSGGEASVPAEVRDLCARVCEQQHRCEGDSSNDETLVHCASACFRNVQERPELAARLQVLSTCLEQGCGPVVEACLERASAPAESESEPTPPSDPAPTVVADSLSPAECQTVCEKILECLTLSEDEWIYPGEALQACKVGCSETPNVDVVAIRKLRNVLRCASTPCGSPYRECMGPSE